MKKRFLLSGMVLFAVLAIVFGGCSFNSDELITSAEGFFSGVYDGMHFIVEKISISTKSAGPTVPVLLQGKLKDGSNVYKLNGLYDSDTGNYVLSGGSSDAGFQIYGFHSTDGKDGKGYKRSKSYGAARAVGDGAWDESTKEIIFDDTYADIPDSVNTNPAAGLPEIWFGKWDYCKPVNAQAVEPWSTAWGDPGDFCLVLTPQGIRTWVNMIKLEADIDYWFSTVDDVTPEQIAAFKQEQLAIYATLNYDINVLEVERVSATDYRVLVSLIPPASYGEGETQYRKIRFLQTATGLNATLAVLEIEDPESGWGRCSTDDIDEARAATNFTNLTLTGFVDGIDRSTNTLVMTRG